MLSQRRLQYTPLTKAKKLKAGSGGFLSRSSSKPLLGEDGEPDFLVTSKVHSAALEGALSDTCKTLEKVLKHQTACASSYAELATALSSFSTGESHPPLSEGMKGLAEAMTHIAQLETGQTNATALVLGDSLAYEMVEARSAKDALLQRQYNIDELRNSIKSTISKRRTIEKLKASGNIKPERVNEALDDLEDAAKHEQNLQNKVEAISRNLRPALQTHLRTMNDDMLSIALGQARTMLAYENRKLQVYDAIHAKIARIPERGTVDQSVVYYHQTKSDQPAAGPSGAGMPAVPTSAAHSVPGPIAQTMSPSISQHTNLSASTIDTTGGAHSKFMATQAAIQAEMQAQREREERQRAQFAQARQYQHQKQASIGCAPTANNSAASNAPVPSTSSHEQAQTPTSPKASQQAATQLQSASHSSGQPLQRSHEEINQRTGTSSNNMSQSMFISNQQQGITSAPLRQTPQSPSRLQRTASITHSPSSGIDPLSPGGPLASSSSTVQHIPHSSAPYSHQSDRSAYTNNTNQQSQPPLQNQLHSQVNGNMTQSVFLPGRTAQPGYRPASSHQQQQHNIVDERKRADARKAASFLAGAF